MNYEQKYKEALERAKYALTTDMDDSGHWAVNYIFPELKEDNNDERIRKGLIKAVSRTFEGNKLFDTDVTREEALAWLEKQGEQTKERFTWKPSKEQIAALRWVLNNVPYNKHKEEINGLLDQIKDIPQKDFSPIEPKFKVRDWLQYRYAEPFLVEEITEQGYCNGNSCLPFEWEDEIHLWTIQDAKDGDVLATDVSVFIYAKVLYNKPYAYCGVDKFGVFKDNCLENNWSNSVDNIHPATKEQRDLLFEKMKEAGYEWDSENKKLCGQILKITPKFCVGQLITDNNGTWYKIINIKCLDDWYYEVYDICEDDTHHELCSIIDEKFRENRFVNEIKKMIGD